MKGLFCGHIMVSRIGGIMKRIEEYDLSGNLITWGKEYPCGCKEFQTVLTDGSIGWGETVEKCSTCFFDDQN